MSQLGEERKVKRRAPISYDLVRSKVLKALSEGATLKDIVARFGSPGSTIQGLYSWIWNDNEALEAYWKSNRGLKRSQTELLYKLLSKKSLVAQLLREGMPFLRDIARTIGIDYYVLRYFVLHDPLLRSLFYGRYSVRSSMIKTELISILRLTNYSYAKAAELRGTTREAMRQSAQRAGLTKFVVQRRAIARKSEKKAKRAMLLATLINCNFDRRRAAEKLGISYFAFIQRCRAVGIGGNVKQASSLSELKEQIKSEYNIGVSMMELAEAVFFSREFALESVVRTLLKYREEVKK